MTIDTEDINIRIRRRGAPKVADVYTRIGRRIRDKRVSLGITQETLGKICGVSFQQLQKYETGVNRVPLDKLLTIAITCSVELDYFTKGLNNVTTEDTEATDRLNAGISAREAKLFCEFRKISPEAYDKLVELVKSCLKNTQILSTDNDEESP